MVGMKDVLFRPVSSIASELKNPLRFARNKNHITVELAKPRRSREVGK
jgi:hypothetical protein